MCFEANLLTARQPIWDFRDPRKYYIWINIQLPSIVPDLLVPTFSYSAVLRHPLFCPHDHGYGPFAGVSFVMFQQAMIFFFPFKILSLVTFHKTFCAGNPYATLRELLA